MADICLVHMPFSMLWNPSMALSVLKGEACRAGISTVVEYGNLRLAKKIGVLNYSKFMESLSAFNFLGEMAFNRFAGFSVYRDSSEYFTYALQHLETENLTQQKMYEDCKRNFTLVDQVLDEFLTELVEAVLSYQPKIVGCDVTYEQQNAALALLKRIKMRAPHIVTVLGGNSCTGDCGQALVDYMDQVDFVFSGEADDLFPGFCQSVFAGMEKQAVHERFPSALIAKGRVVSWGRHDMNNLAIPLFDDYFRALAEFGLEKAIDPCLLIEGSRGCWWGEKGRCTFCGIHTSEETLQYRQKESKVIVEELCYQYERYGIDNFIFTDCILSEQHMDEMLRRLKDCPQKFYLFAEIKSNLSKARIQALREAGFCYLQPGIESLQDDLLKLMNKGNRAIKHIELLKHCRTYGLHLIWNLLSDMPMDRLVWYQELAELLPKLTHLYPPTHLNKVIYQRNSLYCQQPQKYGIRLEDVKLYRYVKLDSPDFIERTAEYFFAKPLLEDAERMEKTAILDRLFNQIAIWKALFANGQGDRLNMYVYEDRIEISDLRQIATKNIYTLTGLTRAIYLLADSAININRVMDELSCQYEKTAIEKAVEELQSIHLLVVIGEEILALAVPFPALAYRKCRALPKGRVYVEE